MNDSDIEQILKDDHGELDEDHFDLEEILKEDDNDEFHYNNNRHSPGIKKNPGSLPTMLSEPDSNSKQGIKKMDSEPEANKFVSKPMEHKTHKTEADDLDSLIGNDNDDSQEIIYPQNLVDDILKGIDEHQDHEINKDSSLFSSHKKVFEKFDPLEAIDKEEKQSSEIGYDIESKFTLTNNQSILNKEKVHNISYSTLEVITQKLFAQYEASSTTPIGVALGLPRCISSYPGKYIVIGTSYCLVCVFSNDQREMRVFGGQKEQNYGPVTSMDINREGDTLICGHEAGQLVMWDLNSGSNIKTIFAVHETPVLSVRFWKEGRNNIISSDQIGNVFLLTINRVLFSYTVDKQLLLHKVAGSITSIQVLDKNLAKHHFTKNYTVVALCSMSMMLIVTLEPIVRIIYRINKPTFVKDGVVPSISWGRGALPGEGENRNPLLAVAWGTVIELIDINNSEVLEGKENRNFSIIGHLILDSEIIFMSWISTNLMLCVDTRKDIRIFYSGFFEHGFFDETKHISSHGTRAILDLQRIDSDLSFQTYLKDSQSRVRSSYSNTVFSNSDSNTILMIGYKKIYRGRLYKWSEYIYTQIDKGEWLSSLCLCIDVYRGKNKMFPDMSNNDQQRKTMMKIFFNDLIKKYIEQVGKHFEETHVEGSREELWEPKILTAIDFLVAAENFQYLFTELKNILRRFNCNDLFLKSLEPFILKNKIKYIPNEPFREIVAFYRDQKKLKVLQQLIINMDIESIDAGYTISLCLEFNLYTALIYICTRTDRDFITPIVKMFAVYKGKFEKLESDAQYHGYKCLWYIKMTFQGIMFPDELIPPKDFNEILKFIIMWIFVEENLAMIINIDPFVSFEVLLLLFKGQPFQIIDEDEKELHDFFAGPKKIPESIPNEENTAESSVVQPPPSEKKSIHKYLLEMIFKCCPKNEERLKPHLVKFIANIIAIGKINIEYEVCLESASFLLDNPQILKPFEEDKEIHEIYDEDYYQEKSNLILTLLKECRDKLESTEVLKKLIDMAEISPFQEVLCFLLTIEKEYKRCFDLYLNSKYQSVRKKFFDWIEEVLDQLEKSNPKQFKELVDQFLGKIKELVALNSERTKNLITKYKKNQNSEKNAIMQLAPWPPLQLELLDRVLEERKKGARIDNELLILNISLLAKLDRAKLLHELKNYDYPLDECLKICKENKINEATAFLLERTGAIYAALEIYIEIFTSRVEKAIRKVEKGKLYENALLKDPVRAAQEICKSNNKVGDKDSEKVWFFLVDKILQYYESNLSMKNSNQKIREKYKSLLKIYSDIIKELFENIIENVSLKSLVDQIYTGYGYMSVRDLKGSLQAMLSNYSYEENILRNAKRLIMSDITDDNIKLFMENSRGISFMPSCQVCKKNFTENSSEKVVLYPCNHGVHKSCKGPNPSCLVCMKEDNHQLVHMISKIRGKLPIFNNVKKNNEESVPNFNQEEQEDGDSFLIKPQKINVKEVKLEIRDKTLRKLKVFDYRKDEEMNSFDQFKAKYDIF